MSSYLLTVAGTERRALISDFTADMVLNGTDNIVCTVISEDGSPEVRFELDEEVVLSLDASPDVPVVGGFITHVDEDGEGGPNTGRFLSRLTITGYAEILQRRHITITADLGSPGSPGPSVDDFLAYLVTTYWATEGITLHPSQSTSAVLKEVEFKDALGTEILNRIASDSGLFWRVDELKRLRMWAKGDVAAPFDIDEDDLPALYFGDIRTTKARYDGYANRVIVKGQTQTVFDHGESVVSDGIQTVFMPSYTMVGTRAGSVPVTNVPSMGIPAGQVLYESLRQVGQPYDTIWEMDKSAGTFTRLDGPLPSGAVMRLIFDGVRNPRGEANDLADQALYPVRDEIVSTPVTTSADAQDLAEQILPYLVAAKDIKARYSTRELDELQPGQTQTIAAATRNLSGQFLITQVTIRSEAGGDDLIREVQMTQGDMPRGDWRNLLAQFASGVSSSNVSNGNGTGNAGNNGGDISTNEDGDGTGGSSIAIPPADTDVFFNKKGAIGTHRANDTSHVQVIYQDDAVAELGGSPDEYERMQFRLTTLSNVPSQSLQKWQTPATDGSPEQPADGVVTMTPWDAAYPGELIFGAEMENDEYIARSEFALFLSMDATGDGFAALTMYKGLTIGEPIDPAADYVQINLTNDTTFGAGGKGGFGGSVSPSFWQSDILALRDNAGTGNWGLALIVSDTFSNHRQLFFRMGDANRTIRFDGVGTPVTFT